MSSIPNMSALALAHDASSTESTRSSTPSRQPHEPDKGTGSLNSKLNWLRAAVLGANDGIVPSYFDVNWYNAIGSKDKKIIEWEGLMHETINEPVKDQVDDTIINWINAHNK